MNALCPSARESPSSGLLALSHARTSSRNAFSDSLSSKSTALKVARAYHRANGDAGHAPGPGLTGRPLDVERHPVGAQHTGPGPEAPGSVRVRAIPLDVRGHLPG